MNEHKQEKEKVDVSKLMSLRTIPYMKTYKPIRPRLSYANRSLTNPNFSKQNKPKIESAPPEPVPIFRVCTCRRFESTNLKGFRISFQFSCPDGKKFSAKIKPHSDSSIIGISEGSEAHVHSDNFIGVILFGNDFCDASLRKEQKFGTELLSMQIRLPLPDTPREVEIHFFNQPPSVPNTLLSKSPSIEEGSWVLDLHSQNVVASIKNCSLEDSNGRTFIIVRKTDKDILEIEARRDIDDLRLFAVAITSFLCKD